MSIGYSEENRECVSLWVTPEIKKEVEKLENNEEYLKMIKKIIANNKLDMKHDLEALEEDTIMYRGLLLSYKKEFENVYRENAEKICKTWQEYDENLPKLKPLVDKFNTMLNPVSLEVREMLSLLNDFSKELENINTYRLQETVKLIDTIMRTDNRTKDILLKVLKTDENHKQ